jgi:PAS domain S-box-containing protein
MNSRTSCTRNNRVCPQIGVRQRAWTLRLEHAEEQVQWRLRTSHRKGTVANQLVQRMLDVLDNGYADALTLRTLGTSIGRQPAYLGRIFRQQVGSTVRDYLTRVRLEHAAELIHDGVKIEAVALSVGYRSKKNFYRQFKRHFGTTPLPYRAQGARALAVYHGPRETATAADAPRQARQTPPGSSSEPEPVLGRLGTLMRASNKAWRLAVETQQLMLAQFARSRVAMLLTDDVGRYVSANPAAVSLTGYSVPELHHLSQADLFARAPEVEVRCVWQLLLSSASGCTRSPNAAIRGKAGDVIGVSLVTLKNMLWGRRELSAVLDRMRPAAG